MEKTFVDLRDDQVRSFLQQGNLYLGRMTTEQELTWLQHAYDEIVKRKTGYTPDELGQRNADPGQNSLVTILSPERFVPDLQNTTFYCNARRTLARLFAVGEADLLFGWRLFLKCA